MEPVLSFPSLKPVASEGFRDLLEAVRAWDEIGSATAAAAEGGRGRSVSLSGLPLPGKALHLLALHAATGHPIAIIVRSDSEAEAFLADLKALAAAFSLACPAGIHLFPSLDADPYQGLAPHLSRVSHRVGALAALAARECAILVVPVESLFTALPPPGTFASRCVTLETGTEWSQADDTAWFVSSGYERVDMVSSPGEFSRRGGVVDIFPPNLDRPVRIELDGPIVESIRAFDPEGQRSTEKIVRCVIAPAREVPLSGAERATLSRALMKGIEGKQDRAGGRTGVGVGAVGAWTRSAARDSGTRSGGVSEAAGRLIGLLERQGRFPGVETCARIALPATATIIEHAADHLLVIDEPEMMREEARNLWADLLRSYESSPGTPLPEPELLFVSEEEVERSLAERARIRMRHLRIAADEEESDESAVTEIHIASSGSAGWRGRIGDLLEELRRRRGRAETTCLLMNTPGTTQRMREILEEGQIGARILDPDESVGEDQASIYLATAAVSAGFSLPQSGWHLVAERDVFGARPAARPRPSTAAFASDFRDLRVGDLIVHIDHGIGRYEGLTKMPTTDATWRATVREASTSSPTSAAGLTPAASGPRPHEIEAMILTYQNGDRLYVPVDRLDLVQKYSGAGGKPPVLDRLGGQSWTKTKGRIRREMEEMAVELLNLYAARKTVQGHPFAADTDWQKEFEAAFPYVLTPDQEKAVEAIKKDMEGPAPMDRLLCGDVGFGKTEVALRAAFKAVMDGKQVAILAPTTVLAFQHFNTFKDRFAPFPAKVEMLNRFRTPSEQSEITARLAAGEVDIVIGTHRLLSADVGFRSLGLLIVDEEQRFGVTHKEKIKQLRKSVDVLTLTATPIPRTLQMAMAGVLDLSMVETPPESRLAIQTHLVPFKETIIAPAIRHELQRGGQVYFVHNRVESIWSAANLVHRLVPEARLVVAHGQMGKNDLEGAMMKFVNGEADILVSTTIIENGLDIPRVNTLIVNRADRFGLAQLYQLRGRIGRSDRQAYAYLLVPPEKRLNETARRRLQVLQDFTELGSGFRIAAMDLEIRGAGSLLGHRQHGHIAAVGFEMYCRMLQRTIEEMREGEALPEFHSQINLGVDLRIPESYIPEEGLRLVLYKKVASARTPPELDAIRDEMEDRFGRLPAEGTRLIEAAKLRLEAEKLHVQQIDLRSGVLQVKFAESSPADPKKLLALVRGSEGAVLTPSGLLKMPARWEADQRIERAREALRGLA